MQFLLSNISIRVCIPSINSNLRIIFVIILKFYPIIAFCEFILFPLFLLNFRNLSSKYVILKVHLIFLHLVVLCLIALIIGFLNFLSPAHSILRCLPKLSTAGIGCLIAVRHLLVLSCFSRFCLTAFPVIHLFIKLYPNFTSATYSLFLTLQY